MQGNAEDGEGAAEERDRYGREPDAEDIDEYTEPEPYDVEPEPYGRGATAQEATVVPGDEPAGARVAAGADPDVFLDVPLLKVDEIDLDVEDLRAHVSLQAEVLDLVKLNVGADVALGRVHLGISGVEAQAQLRVRLDNVASIIHRVLTTLDRNPEIRREVARGVGSAVQDVGGGARQGVGELGTGAGRAVQDVGLGAGAAVQDVGRGVGSAAQDLGRGAGSAVRDVGSGAGRVVEEVGGEAGRVVGKTGAEVGDATGKAVEKASGVAEAAGDAVRDGGRAIAEVPDVEVPDAQVPDVEVPDAQVPDVEVPDAADGTTHRTESAARGVVRRPAKEGRRRAVRDQEGTRARRVRTEDGKPAPRPRRHRTSEERDEPPP
nr:hypothetical protein [Streptomyces sp. NRRL WC-3744]